MLFDTPSIVACTICRDVQKFDLLIGDMQATLGDRWGDIALDEALAFLQRSESDGLDFVALAIDSHDEAGLQNLLPIVAAARQKGIRVILVAQDVSPAALHQLLREGADDFIPYPLPEGELRRVATRPKVSRPDDPASRAASPSPDGAESNRSGVVIPIYSMAGGAGGTTLAVNLAWELANLSREAAPRVCLIDLGLQFGSVATLLDLPRREAVLELLSNTEGLDGDAFEQALQTHADRLHVFTAPSDLVPLDLIDSKDVDRLIETARAGFDYVLIDMPPAMADWGEAVLNAAHVCFAVLGLDMRAAQNTLRIKRVLTSEGLPFHKFRFVLNRAPGFADFQGRSRVRRLAESLGISIEIQLPDGGKPVSDAADEGVPLAEAAPKNALRKEIAKLARQIHEVNLAEAAPQKARARA